MGEKNSQNNFNDLIQSHNQNDYFFDTQTKNAQSISARINESKKKNISNFKGQDSSSDVITRFSLKSIGKNTANSTINKASQSDNDVVKAVGKAAQGIKGTVKAASFLKKAGVFFATPLGWGCLIVLGIFIFIILGLVIVYQVIDTLGLKYNLSEDASYEIYSEKYEEGMKRAELDDIYENSGMECGGNTTIWWKIFRIADLGNPADFCHYIKEKVLQENEDKVKPIKPGYLLSTLYYAYESQDRNDTKALYFEDEDATYDAGDIDIISFLFAKKVFKKEEHIEFSGENKTLIDNYLIHYTYTPYVYVSPTPTEDEETEEGGGEQEESTGSCERGQPVDRYEIDEFKYKLFLRYGKEVASAYEYDVNRNKEYDATSEQCKYLVETHDLSKYEVVADPTTTIDDNATVNGHSYQDGFIYKNYPRYDSDYSSYAKPFTYMIAKEIEEIINDISEREDYTNYILGYRSKLGEGGNRSSSSNCSYSLNGIDVSNIKVRLLYDVYDIYTPFTKDKQVYDGKPIEGEKDIPFEDWVYGVAYHEIATAYPGEEYKELWKAQAIMARSFGLSRPSHYNANGVSLKEENGEWILSLRNGRNDAAYCNPETGCYTCEGLGYGAVTFSADALPDGLTEADNLEGKCKLWVAPESEETSMRKYVDETRGILLYDNKGEVAQAGWPSMDDYNIRLAPAAKEGKDYVELLELFYYGEFTLSQSTCTGPQNGTLSESEKEEYLDKVLSQFPDLSNDRIKAITVALNSHGLPYFWGGGHGSLENMIDIAENKWGKEYCKIEHDGLDSQPYGSQQLCGFDCSGFVRYIMYAATGIDPGAAGTGNIVANSLYSVVDESELLPGDIGIINGDERPSGIGHVGIFMYKDEDGKLVFIHESNGVEIGHPTFTKYRRYNNMN